MASIRELFDQVSDLPANARRAALLIKGADEASIARVLALLDADATLSTRARQPLSELAAHLLETELKTGDTVGVWRLARELGHGGMGSVFLAERADGHFSQRAAIKLIRGRADAHAAQRFERERQLLANLQHPRIARLIDGGATPEGQPYLVMEYVEGEPIVEWCRQRRVGLTQRLALFRSICETVQFAHNQLVVHCDLKPSNVLVRADGTAVLLDFGIARVADSKGDDTAGATLDLVSGQDSGQTSHTLMTPRYASPEQLRGEAPGIASDVFSLGLMLFELVTDNPPPRDRSLPLPWPSKAGQHLPWHRHLGGDIDAIVARACAPIAMERYSSVAALGDEVSRMGKHQPVLAREGQRLYTARRFLRRRWLPLSVAALVIVLSASFTWRTLQAERNALREAAVAQQATDFMASVFAGADTDVTNQHIVELTALDVLAMGRQRIATELADSPAVRARLLEAIGNAYRHQQDNVTGVPMLAESVQMYLHPEVNDTRSAARAISAQTNAMANGEFPGRDIEAVAERALELARAASEPGSQTIANALMTLSLAYNRNGRFDEAREAAEASYAINYRRRDLPNHRYGPALNNLGLILANLGEFDEAHENIDRVIAFNLPESTSIAMNYRVKGLALIRSGDFSAALQRFEHALHIAIQHFGDGSPYAIYYRSFVAASLNLLGRHAEADAVLQRALEQQQAFGLEAGEALLLLQEQAAGDLLSGRTSAALIRSRDVWDKRRALYGEDDPRTVQSQQTWALAALQSGHTTPEVHAAIAAGITYWAARNQYERPFGLAARLRDAQMQLVSNDPAAAQATLDGILPYQHRLFMHDRLQLMLLQAWSARARGDDAALRLARATFEAHHNQLGDEHPRTALAALLLNRTRTVPGQSDPAADALQQKWRRIYERGLPADSAFLQALPDA